MLPLLLFRMITFSLFNYKRVINNIIVIRRFTHTGLCFSILQTSLRRLFYFFPCDNKVERLVIYYGYKCRLLTFFPLGDIVAHFRFFRRRFPGLTDATFQFSFLLQFLCLRGSYFFRHCFCPLLQFVIKTFLYRSTTVTQLFHFTFDSGRVRFNRLFQDTIKIHWRISPQSIPLPLFLF